MQLIEILKVFQSGVKVMHPSRQPNKAVKFLDNVKSAELSQDAMVMWGSEYVVEASKKPPRKKIK